MRGSSSPQETLVTTRAELSRGCSQGSLASLPKSHVPPAKGRADSTLTLGTARHGFTTTRPNGKTAQLASRYRQFQPQLKIGITKHRADATSQSTSLASAQNGLGALDNSLTVQTRHLQKGAIWSSSDNWYHLSLRPKYGTKPPAASLQSPSGARHLVSSHSAAHSSHRMCPMSVIPAIVQEAHTSAAVEVDTDKANSARRKCMLASTHSLFSGCSKPWTTQFTGFACCKSQGGEQEPVQLKPGWVDSISRWKLHHVPRFGDVLTDHGSTLRVTKNSLAWETM